MKCVLSANVDEKQPNKLIEVCILKQRHCTEYVTGVTVAVEILELKSRSYNIVKIQACQKFVLLVKRKRRVKKVTLLF